MSKKNLRELVEEIQKYAKKPPPPPAGYKVEAPAPTAAPVAGNAPAARSGARPVPKPGQPAAATHSNVSTEIQKMQFAMQRVAKTVSSTINYDALTKALQGNPGVDKRQVEKSIGRDAFSTILINRMRGAKTKGVEFDPNQSKTKMQDKNPSDLKSLFVVLDSLRRIGAGKDEGNPDGAWGPRTNNGLKNIASVAEALNKLGTELAMQSQAFDPSHMEQLNSLIPESDKEIDQNEKVKRAPVIAKLLAGVQALVLDFKDQILANPNYAVFIDDQKSLFDVGADKEKVFQPENEGEKLIYDSLRNEKSKSRFIRDTNGTIVPVASVKIPAEYTGGKELPPFNITGADLVDKESFDHWANSNSVLMNLMKSNPTTWNNVVSFILSDTQKQIQQKLQGPATTPLQETR